MPSDDDDWAFEIRWSGERAIALVDTGHLTLLDADGEDLRPLFPELFAIALELEGRPVALDGVVAVLGEDGAAVGARGSSAGSAPRRTRRSAAAASRPRRR